MAENLDILNVAVSLAIRAALLAARFSGRVRKRSLKRLAAMDADTKDKEITFLRDHVGQLRMQVSEQLASASKHMAEVYQKGSYGIHVARIIESTACSKFT